MGGGHVGPCLPIQPHHEREEEISEDPRALLQQMRKISHRRGASMDSFLAPHRCGEGEGHHMGGRGERERHLTRGGEGQLMGGWEGGEEEGVRILTVAAPVEECHVSTYTTEGIFLYSPCSQYISMHRTVLFVVLATNITILHSNCSVVPDG